MNDKSIIGGLALGALLAPVTGGASLAIALAGVSAGSIVTKMNEYDQEEKEAAVAEALAEQEERLCSDGAWNGRPAANQDVNLNPIIGGRVIRF